MLMTPYVIRRNDWVRVAMLEGIVSFIWTERYNQYGDFKLVLHYTHETFHFLRLRWYIEIDDSDYLMIIEGIELTKDEDGAENIEVTGYSVEKFLQHRAIVPNTSDPDYWVREGRMLILAGQLVNRICIRGDLSERDIIPNLRYEQGPGVGDIYQVQQPTNESLYDAVKKMCDVVDGGFKISYNNSTKLMTFQTYVGLDRSVTQNNYTHVIFSRKLNNLRYNNFFKSQIDNKTAAYVVAADGYSMLVNDPGGASQGMDYRLLYVNATDIDNPNNAKLRARGLEELSQHNYTNLVETQVVDNIYNYNTHYYMGDIVSLERFDGSYARARVTEFVRTLDSGGYREYPTFTDLEEDGDL